ncbi:WXG100 family type VII secretion target [Nocardia mexicana]|uniref:WXG100 family type VII secretion target n=1 Tax=Nocardia mexicana TaxID=279262 RepID=A0A370H7I4_9NOCA|nr:WXG100 family type VII secretion target [Nocardia mexicana]RDI52652.1 WXG100 family type VII secretion target [Nocardia mexicana]
MGFTKYNPAIIVPGLGDLRGSHAKLTTDNQDIQQAAAELMAIWRGKAADNFDAAHKAWMNEFSDTLTKLQDLINVSQSAMDEALALDASLAGGFGA